MFSLKNEVQGTITLSQSDYILILVDSFLIDRRAQGLSPETVLYYRKKLKYFLNYCESQAVTQLEHVTSDLIRRYLISQSDTHNPGGIHACFRALRALLYWVELENIMPEGWNNPIRRVKAPKVPDQPIEPISLEEVSALLDTCKKDFTGVRDKAVLLTLLDTGARAQELMKMNIDDLDMATGAVMIRQGKGRKPRIVFLGRKTRRAVRAYFRHRRDANPAIWITVHEDRMTYSALRGILRRRSMQAGLRATPSPHDFRRAFALNMLRNGVDIFALQRLMGHSDLQVLRRYLAQTDEDIQIAHMRGSPVDNGL